MTNGNAARQWSEEMLLAYVDGEMPADQMRELELAIRDDAEAQDILALLRRSRDALRGVFDAPLAEPVPPHLLAALAGGRSAPDPSERHGSKLNLRKVLLPLAASLLLLVVGFGTGYVTRPIDNDGFRPAGAGSADPATEAFESALLRALENGVDGASFIYLLPGNRGEAVVTLLGRVETRFGGACREFRHRVPDKVESVGIACRVADGGWTLMTLPDDRS